MSKTVDLQVEKVSGLIEGIRKNQGRLSAKGICVAKLDELDREIAAVAEANRRCEELRAECSAQIKLTNGLLENLKREYAIYRNQIRNNFPQEQWIEFGLQDKR